MNNNTTYESCFICQDDYNENNTNTTITNCNHKYHCTCLLHWLSIGKQCPYCNELLIERNLPATNIEDLRRQIIETERIRIQRKIEVTLTRLKNEMKAFLIREDFKYSYWNNFKEYCDHYNKTIEEVKDFISINMGVNCTIINEGNVLRMKRCLYKNKIHTNFKIHFDIK